MTTEQLTALEAHGWKPYYEKGNAWNDYPEWFSPDGKFRIEEDAVAFLKALESKRAAGVAFPSQTPDEEKRPT